LVRLLLEFISLEFEVVRPQTLSSSLRGDTA